MLMKDTLPHILNIPPFTFRGVNVEKLNILQKIIFIFKGKLLSITVEKFSKKNFCTIINYFYREDSKIYFENGKYKKLLLSGDIISYPNKRILRMVNGHEDQLKKFLKIYCIDFIKFDKEDIVIDCGANVGELNMALKYASIFINYIGFEPDMDTFACLELNNPEQKNKLYMQGLSNQIGEKDFFIDNDGGNSSLINFGKNEKITINTVTLDSLQITTKIKLFKIDAEGFEPEVIEGSLGTLNMIHFISVDFGHERGPKEESTVIDVNKILTKEGFELVKFSDHRLIGLYENKKYQ